jgi:hypothetical protein
LVPGLKSTPIEVRGRVLGRWIAINIAIQTAEVGSVVGFGLVAHPQRDLWVVLALALVLGNALGLQLAMWTIMRAAR